MGRASAQGKGGWVRSKKELVLEGVGFVRLRNKVGLRWMVYMTDGFLGSYARAVPRGPSSKKVRDGHRGGGFSE